MTARQRVVITGAGTVNPLGENVSQTFAAMREGRGAIGPLELPDLARLHTRIGAQIHNWQPEALFSPRQLALSDRATQFALCAAREAIGQAGLSFDGDLGLRSGVILGTAGGGHSSAEAAYRSVFQDGRDRVHPFTVPKLMHSASASHISLEWGIRGPVFSVTSACASANHAMGLAFQMIRAGMAASMVTGGSDAMLNFSGVKAWEGLRVLSPDACRPFSADRNGMVLGEGAGIFVFEALDHARGRGAEILAEVTGFAMTADAADMVQPSVDGPARAIIGALHDARMGAEPIGYINAHGTGTRANDKVESAAILKALGAAGRAVPVSSTKSLHGHLMGGAGAVELLACLLALREGVIAPTLGYRSPDPDCPLNIVHDGARNTPVRAILSNAFAFGGLNAVLALAQA